MKTKLLWILPAIVAGLFLLTSFGGSDDTDRSSGSPGGYTGSPGDGHNCTACHGGSASTVTGWITSDIPSDGYTPGSTYTITATVSGSGNKGFEISPQTPAGALLGSLTPGSGNKLCNSNKAITHTTKLSSNPAVWTFQWTAPAAGSGTVTFYGAFAITENSTKLSTMVVSEASGTPLTATATATPSSVCAGQSSQLDVTAGGGNPPYTYSWTSNPAGFTSNLQNPMVTPTVTTVYSVQVGDGTGTASSSVTVTVTPAPTAAAGSDSTVCIDAIQFQISGTASSYASVAWTTSGDGTFGSATSLSTSYFPGSGDHITGYVNLTLTASPVSPCSGAATSVRHIIFDPCTGLEGKTNEAALVLSPNPSTGMVYLSMSGFTWRSGTVTVFNEQGKPVLSKTIEAAGQQAALDLTSLPGGLYYIKVLTGDKIMVGKVILY
jgi:hypothetical protein